MTYIRNAWYVGTWAHDVGPERPVSVCVLNDPIVIWRAASGNLAAFADRCIHRLAPLSLGRCEGDKLRCMYHGFLYDRTGHVVEIPGQRRIPSGLRVPTYPVVERHSWVWIWMGHPSAADERLIPPLMGLDHSDYLLGHGQLDYAAEARLINDNLLDLSHVSFLHAESFRMSASWAQEQPQVTERQRSVRSERWFRNEGFTAALDFDQPVDTYFRQEFHVPGVLLMTAIAYPVGTAEALNGQQPPELNRQIESSAIQESFSTQAVTPLTDKTTRYFYIVGRRPQGEESTYNLTTYHKGFAEDKAMIEAQQRNIDLAAGQRFLATTADRGVAAYNRLLTKLALAEGRSSELSP